ncbi:MAG: hypothetical protein ACFFCF_02545 [Promethearchaeota archaeon]
MISLTATRRKPCPFLPRMEHLLTSYELGNGDFYLLSVGFSLEKVHSGRRNPTQNAIFKAPKRFLDGVIMTSFTKSKGFENSSFLFIEIDYECHDYRIKKEDF